MPIGNLRSIPMNSLKRKFDTHDLPRLAYQKIRFRTTSKTATMTASEAGF